MNHFKINLCYIIDQNVNKYRYISYIKLIFAYITTKIQQFYIVYSKYKYNDSILLYIYTITLPFKRKQISTFKKKIKDTLN